jgi:hypothetical protein
MFFVPAPRGNANGAVATAALTRPDMREWPGRTKEASGSC